VAQSNLSGSPIEPDAKTKVLVRLADGRAWRLTLTSAEVGKLAAMGESVGGLWQRIAAFFIRNWRSFAWWAFGILIASVLLPAATKQWADRQAALTLKSSMTLDISKSAVSAVRAAQNVTQATDWDQARKVRNEAENTWVIGESGVDPVFAVYFDNTTALTMWKEYQSAIYQYTRLACCDPKQEEYVDSIHRYFEKYSLTPPGGPSPLGSNPWSILRSSSIQDPAFGPIYQSLGQQLLRRRGDLLKELLRTPARGYSSGFVDFWRDVVPGW